ncbi:GNAT family N-acetyltransferase [Bacillus sp. 165]|uniref:GNAT family N-acetyltransferase n=1 Tax=Bacillus sp. 165 TaxID=1529117 RepID=UPI001AD9F9AD|nr:GNAT family N-acetyltransferase [Bacillus sp. 165]MBO9129995.1 GNAT family N-acetyltransferase [Bacillus sp. 165]
MYQVISFTDKHKWEEALQQFSQKDVYYFQEYCSLYHTIGDGEPFLFLYKDKKGNKLCYIFIKRPIQSLPFVTQEEGLYDIITPYGYGGPLYDDMDEEGIREFRKEFEAYCQSENIISEFVRFHPLLHNHKHLENTMDVIYDRETIYIDLSKSEEEMFAQYHTNHKRSIKKALKNQLEFKVFMKEEAIAQTEAFFQLYCETMDKLNASSYYYFSNDYVKQLLSGLYENVMIGAVFFEGKMISAALCMYEGDFLHYHLGCSKKEYLHLGTNVFQFHNIALWGKENGCRTFHLGGGHVGRDSLFQFKHRFHQEGTVGFYVGKKILQPERYQELVGKWEEYYSQQALEGFFPAYRRQVKVHETV